MFLNCKIVNSNFINLCISVGGKVVTIALVRSAAMIKKLNFTDLTLRAKLTYVAHLVKGVCKQHHVWMTFLLRKFIKSDSIILDIGGHSGQYAKLLARLAPQEKFIASSPDPIRAPSSGFLCV